MEGLAKLLLLRDPTQKTGISLSTFMGKFAVQKKDDDDEGEAKAMAERAEALKLCLATHNTIQGHLLEKCHKDMPDVLIRPPGF